MHEEEWVTAAQLAEDLHVTARYAARIAKDYGVEPVRRRVEGSTSPQRKLAWTRAQADAIKAKRNAAGFMP